MSTNEKIDLRVRRTRLSLQGALEELMAEKPYQEITVSEIVDRALVARPTFYLHYETKDYLLNSLIDDLFADFQTEVKREWSCQYMDLERFGLLLIIEGEKNAERLRILINSGLEYLLLKQICTVLTNLITEVRDADSLALHEMVIQPYIVDFAAGGFFMLLKRWIEDDLAMSSESLGLMVGEIAKTFRHILRDWPLQKPSVAW
ncbi:MAG: TetR-like C-terminal domain-containing protein [Chloroflexota bacterium]